MSALKKLLTDSAAYKLAAAARREKVAVRLASSVDAVRPSHGRIRVSLGGKPVSRTRETAILGGSSISIPEFTTFRKR